MTLVSSPSGFLLEAEHTTRLDRTRLADRRWPPAHLRTQQTQHGGGFLGALLSSLGVHGCRFPVRANASSPTRVPLQMLCLRTRPGPRSPAASCSAGRPALPLASLHPAGPVPATAGLSSLLLSGARPTRLPVHTPEMSGLSECAGQHLQGRLGERCSEPEVSVRLTSERWSERLLEAARELMRNAQPCPVPTRAGFCEIS